MKTSSLLLTGLLLIGVVGCGKSASKGGAEDVKETAIHKADECPAETISGKYLGKSDFGQRMTVEFFKNSKGTLSYKAIIVGYENQPVTVVVDGKAHTVPELGVNSYISLGCSNGKLNGVTRYEGRLYKGEYVFGTDSFTINSTAPKESTSVFKKTVD